MEVTSSPRPRILYVITKANWGGAQRYVFDLASAARDRKFEVAVAYGAPGELAERLSAASFKTYEIVGLGRDVRTLKDAAAFFSLLKIMREFKPDIVHLNSSKIGGLGALAARLCSVKHIVFTAHGWAFNENRPGPAKVVIKFLYWLTMLLSKRTIAVSETMRSQVRSFPFVQNKISVIHNGVEALALLPRNEARTQLANKSSGLAALLGEHPDTPLIGSTSELHPIKGLAYLIEAAAKLSGTWSIVLIGEGEERTNLEEAITRLGLAQRVFLLGQIPDVKKYLAGLDIFTIPSLSEGLAYGILEAGAAGLPVVASRVGGIPELIEDGRTGLLVPPAHPSALSNAIERLLEGETYRAQLGQALKEKIEKEFSIRTMIERTFTLY